MHSFRASVWQPNKKKLKQSSFNLKDDFLEFMSFIVEDLLIVKSGLIDSLRARELRNVRNDLPVSQKRVLYQPRMVCSACHDDNVIAPGKL